MRIVVLDGYASNPGDLSWKGLEKLGECVIYDRTGVEQVLPRCKDTEMVITNKVKLDASTISALPKLKYIGVMATGYNVVDVTEATRRGVVVTNVPAYSTESVAQLVFAHILCIANRVQHYTNEIRKGKWCACKDFSYFNTPLIELDGKIMGIIGLGNIGKRVAELAQAFHMHVQAVTSKSQQELPAGVTKVDIDTLFKTSDVVTLHCPLTPETRNIVTLKRLHDMKASAILINCARGGLVNEYDLADVLEKGGLQGAGLDVLDMEPPLEDNPLLHVRNCHMTPHIGWATKEARVRLMETVVANAKAFVDGQPQNVVNEQL